VCEACQGLWTQAGVRQGDRAGRGRHDAARHRGQPGRDGKPLRPAITWLDQRRTDIVPPIGLVVARWRSSLARVKQHHRLLPGEAEINWIKRAPAGHLGQRPTNSCCCPAT
jgi:hypothetical protein